MAPQQRNSVTECSGSQFSFGDSMGTMGNPAAKLTNVTKEQQRKAPLIFIQ